MKRPKAGADDFITAGLGEPDFAEFSREPLGWLPPQPLPTGLPPVPAFNADALLPSTFAPWTADIAERAQCPVDFVAVAAVTAASAVLGRRCTIRPKRHDDWTVVPNLWGLVVGPPGIMKTPAVAEALRPLQRLVAEAREAYQAEARAHEFTLETVKAQKAELITKIKAALKRGEDAETFRAQYEALTCEPPTERRYLVNDATVEKLGELLNENPNGLLVYRDELGGFLRSMDREGHENDRAFFCEAWNGTGAYTYDRIGRGTVRIEAACVSLLGGLQPGPLTAYLGEMLRRGGATDDGLLQRFQLLVYPAVVQQWRNVDRWPDTSAKSAAFEVFRRLVAFDPAEVGAQRDTPEVLPYLRFTPAAQARFDQWRARLEPRLRDDAEHPAILSHLAKYRSLLPALALLFHLMDCLAHGRGGPVSDSALEQAEAWCAYLEAHARRVYHAITAAAELATLALAAKLSAGALPSPFRPRAVRRHQWSGLTDMADIFTALDWLVDLHWLRRLDVPSTTKGGRPTVAYLINPAVSGGGA